MNATKINQVLTKILPGAQPLFEQLNGMQQNKSALPKVVVYGVYNSGKSSLLNSLTGHVEHEYFSTRDIPETKATKTLEQQGICYVDTPGLDVDVADTQQANAGVDQADILMFVHKLSAGPIQMQEMATMQKLVTGHGKPEQVIAVLTGSEGAAEQQGLINEISAQLKALIPHCTPFLVSNPRFQKGVRESKQPLIHHSGIPQLLEDLEGRVAKLAKNLQQQRADKKQRLKNKLLSEIANKKEEISLAIEFEETAAEIHAANFENDVLQLQMLLVQSELKKIHDRL